MPHIFNTMKPLFMWAGGKTRLLKKYQAQDVLPDDFDVYVEPFLGAGAMFIWAYEKNPDAKFYLNDSNESIMNIYRVVRDNVEEFISILDDYSAGFLPRDKEGRKAFYYRLREKHAYEYADWTATQEAAALYFLMKTGFNGIWQINKNTNNRFGTPSGLLNQKDKVYGKENVREWNKALKHISLSSVDFGSTPAHITDNTFVFLDPPYRGSFTQYGVDFDDKLQESVIHHLNSLTARGAHVMMSNRDVGDGFFEGRQGKNKIIYFDVTYTAGRRKKNSDGTHSAKKAREILMIGRHNGSKS